MNQNANPLVTCIIATRNSEKYLQCCLESLINNIHDFPPNSIEVIFIDYKSNDKTLSIQNEFCSLHKGIIVNANDPGIPLAHNIGVQMASGSYISFLNSDDIYSQHFLINLYRSTKAKELCTPLPVVSYGTVEFIDSLTNTLYYRYPPTYIKRIHEYSSIILHPNALYPTDLMKMIPFEVTQTNKPTDREQVMEIMGYAVSNRVKTAAYKFRISDSSHTVREAVRTSRINSNNASTGDLIHKLLVIISRIYIHAHETVLLKRIIQKIFRNKTYWSL